MPTPWAAFSQSVRRFQSDKVSPWMGLRNALGVALPLVAGAAFGSMPAGLAMSSGALNVAFRDSHAPYAERARQLLSGSLVAGFTVFAATLCGKYDAPALVLTAIWAFSAGMLVAISQPAADLGVMSLVMLLVYAAVPQPPGRAVLAGLLALTGGLIQTALALAIWRLRPYAPERHALATLYLELSRSAVSPPKPPRNLLPQPRRVSPRKMLCRVSIAITPSKASASGFCSSKQSGCASVCSRSLVFEPESGESHRVN